MGKYHTREFSFAFDEIGNTKKFRLCVCPKNVGFVVVCMIRLIHCAKSFKSSGLQLLSNCVSRVFFKENVRYLVARDPIFSDFRNPMIIFSDSRDPV